jgi:hypothetical protein
LHGNCPSDRPGRRFGIHDVDRLIRGNIVHSAWEEGGFWAIDISDVYNSKVVAYYIPPVKGNAIAVMPMMCSSVTTGSCSSDTGAGGLWAMRVAPGVKGTVSLNADNTDVIVKHVGVT